MEILLQHLCPEVALRLKASLPAVSVVLLMVLTILRANLSHILSMCDAQ